MGGGSTTGNGGNSTGGSMSSGSGGGGMGVKLGKATITNSNACPSQLVPVSKCYEITITGCEGVADLTATVKVTEPMEGAAGTVVLGNGGGGSGFYEQFGDTTSHPAVDQVINPMLAAGYRVVQRSWKSPPNTSLGWMVGPGGAKKLACRYATLLQAVKDNFHKGGAVCASGNSGGAAEIAYALAHYGMGEVLDGAVMTAGPPMGRIDYGCLGSSAWASECAKVNPGCDGEYCCHYTGQSAWMDALYGPNGNDCQSKNAAKAQMWHDDSVLSTGAVLSYPNTKVAFVFGGADNGVAAALGRLYAEAVTGATLTTVPNAPHQVPSDVAGAKEIFKQLQTTCKP
jgi:hypothetical protein